MEVFFFMMYFSYLFHTYFKNDTKINDHRCTFIDYQATPMYKYRYPYNYTSLKLTEYYQSVPNLPRLNISEKFRGLHDIVKVPWLVDVKNFKIMAK